MSTSKKSKKPFMRIAQGHVALAAIHSITLMYKKLGLDPKASKRNKRLLMGTSHVPTQLIEEVATAAGKFGDRIGMHFDPDAAREALAYIATFEPVAAEAEAFAARVREAVLAKKADVGKKALGGYHSMKGISKSVPDGEFLLDTVDRMTKIMKRGRRSSTPSGPTAAAEPVAPAQTPAPPLAVAPKPADKPASATVVVQVPQDTKAA